MNHILVAVLLALPLAAHAAETYEQAFVTCSEQAEGADDHSAAVQSCMARKGFTEEQ